MPEYQLTLSIREVPQKKGGTVREVKIFTNPVDAAHWCSGVDQKQHCLLLIDLDSLPGVNDLKGFLATRPLDADEDEHPWPWRFIESLALAVYQTRGLTIS